MKQLLILAFSLAILSILFTGCKKEYTCTCITTDTSGVFGPTKRSTTLAGDNKIDAEEICASSGTTFENLETVCSLD